MIDENKNPWKVTDKKEIYDNPWIKLTEYKVITPSEKPGIYGTVHFKNIAIGILVLDQDYNTYIVGQYRFPLECYSWEIPMGGGLHDKSALESAKRELKEETGIIAKSWKQILKIHLSNSVTDEYGLTFVAKELEFHKASPEEVEELQVKKIAFSELFQMVMDGEITDSLTVASVLKAKIMIEQNLL